MKKILFGAIFILLILTSSPAQDIPDRNRDAKLEAQYKAEQLARLIQLETQKTANQDLYDVKHYDLNLFINVSAKQINGSVNILSEVVNQSINSMDVNLLNSMSVDSITSNSSRLAFSHSNDLIQINLKTSYQPGDLVAVKIYYHGKPQQSGFGAFGFDTYNAQPMVWSLSEPFGARNWWPCKDFPSDKADSADIRITVPNSLIVASNGTLRSEIEQGGYKTFWWHESYPIVTYLISVAIHPYYVYSDYYHYSPTDSMEVRYYVFPDQVATLRNAYAKTVRMIEIYSKIFGEYPFIREKYGHAQFLGNANMEHQTITSLVSRSEGTIVHELAHQWWGDYITCQDFHHIWLNEGFATYSEALYYEREYGENEFWQEVESNKYFGGGTVYVDNLTSTSLIFNYDRTYRKASWILHTLRHVVGDESFFQILKEYYNESRLRYGTATTDDFRAVCERVSGINLEKFFYQWLYEEYFPTYSYTWSWKKNDANYDIRLTIEQLQTNFTFWMPIDVTVTTFSGEQTFVARDSLRSQTFTLSVASEPIALELDEDNWILKQIQQPTINPTFDRGILLVNGVSWENFGSEIRPAYLNRAFWGDYPISFWDCFDEPPDGYPATLPAPLGSGVISAALLGKFSTVIWIGHNSDGDLDVWKQAAIIEYLQSGGNVLLLTRKGRDFINVGLQTYLGISWAENIENQTKNCIADYPGLKNMALTGEQNYNAVFNTTLSNLESTLLFKETASFSAPRGLGVWRKPTKGGTFRSNGGQFVFVSGSPFHYNPDQLKANVEFMLKNFFQESETGDSIPTSYELEQNFPNPFNQSTEMVFRLPEQTRVTLDIYDLLGRKIARLVNQEIVAGRHKVSWNANGIASGIYFYKLQSENFSKTRKMILVR